MPKTATATVYLKTEPKDLPDGVETVTVNRSLKTEKPDNAKDDWKTSTEARSFKLNVPASNAEGLLKFPGFLSDIYGIDGPKFCVEAVRNAMASQASARIALGKESDSLRFVPAIASLRTIDPAELAGAETQAWCKEHPGKAPPADVLARIWAGVTA